MIQFIQNIIPYFVFSLFLSSFLYAHFFWKVGDVLEVNSEECQQINTLEQYQESQKKESQKKESNDSPQKNMQRTIRTPQEKRFEDNLDSDITSTEMEREAILAKYIQDCHNTIFPNWAVNGTLIQQNPELKTTIQVFASEDGTISNPEIVLNSENPSFDKSAIVNMLNTKKLPPHQEYQNFAKSGVYITLAVQES